MWCFFQRSFRCPRFESWSGNKFAHCYFPSISLDKKKRRNFYFFDVSDENGFGGHGARVGEFEIFSSFNQMQSTVPMRSNMLTLTVGMPDLGLGEGGRSVALENAEGGDRVSSFSRDRRREGENGFLVSYFG